MGAIAGIRSPKAARVRAIITPLPEMDAMAIDWDQPAKLTCTPMLNVAWTSMPDFTGTLRSCVQRAGEWPHNSYPTIWLDKPLHPSGKTVIDTSEIGKLRRELT